MWRLNLLLLVLVALFATGDLLARLLYGEGESGTPDLLASIALTISVLWYGAGLLRLQQKSAVGRILAPGRIAGFAGGMGVLLLALESPLDEMAAQLFSIHMTQHLLLMLAAPPLLVWSRPGLVFLWALPRRMRKAIGRTWAGLGFGRGFGWVMHPLVIWVAFSGAFVFWHLPRPYAWAYHSEAIHILEHLCFFLTALAFWSIVLAPYGRRRLGHPATLVFIVTTAILSGLPGALIILSPRPFYAVHATGAAAWHLSLLQDQQLAGLVMWIPAGLVYVGAALWIFDAWLREAELRTSAAALAASRVLPALLLILVGLGLAACDEGQGSESAQVAGGNAAHGAALIRGAGCGGCHDIPGIDGADGRVGPPLAGIGQRLYLAGMLRNTPDNMIVWLRDPQRVVPGNVMPSTNLSAADARDITAYLYTIR